MKMSKTEKTINNSRKTSGYRAEFSRIDRKTEILGILLFFLILGGVVLMGLFLDFFTFIDFTTSLLIFFTFAAIFLLIFMLFPFLWILIKVTYRTRNRNFAFQMFNYLQFTLICTIIYPVSYWLSFEKGQIDPRIPTLFFLSISIFFVLRLFYRNPLFWDEELIYRSSTLLSHQALHIDSEQDGYSQRPLFSVFPIMTEFISSPVEFQVQLEKYARFLGKKGVIVDWDIDETSAILYPRFLIKFVWKFWLIYQFLNRFRMKRNLTTIEISFSPPQLSIRVSPEDYKILAREVTFHSLGQHILGRVQQSLLAFFNNDLNMTYMALFPPKK